MNQRKMKNIVLLLVVYPPFCIGQLIPRIEHDTLFTKSGYKWYPGLQIKFTQGSSQTPYKGQFRFVKEYEGSRFIPLANNTFTITKIEELKVSTTSPTMIT
jgi:hypothetical protein